MPINSPDYQTTRLTTPAGEPPAAGAAAAPATAKPASLGLRARRSARRGRAEAQRVGIVFVHGIGTQQPAETFLDWSAPIVSLLADWQRSIGQSRDPVVRSEFSFSGASQPFLEVEVPAYRDRPATRWVMTEAWWAADLRAPALGAVVRYLRARLGRIVGGIATGYHRRESTWDRRREASLQASEPPPPPVPGAAPTTAADRGPAPAAADSPAPPDERLMAELDDGGRWAWIETLDRFQARALSLGVLVTLVSALGSAALLVWGLVRRVPVGPIQDFAEARVVDSFLVDWFGDLPVLLDDPVQAANVRARVAHSIDALVADGCDAIVLVAHSGGAVVSFETLLDPAYRDRPVDTLVTLGQGLALGWRLAAGPDGSELTRGNRLLGDLAAVRPDLRWVDFWASYDPAPAGPLPTDIPGVPLATASPPVPGGPRPPGAPLLVEERPVTNRMNVLADHGAYWENDEGFLGALVRHLDTPRTELDRARFYREPAMRAIRIARRRQRVAVLAAWDWLCGLVGVLAMVAGIAFDAGTRFRAGGHALTAAWNVVPGHELVSGPVHAFGVGLGSLGHALGLDGVLDAVAPVGPLLASVALAAALVVLLASFGNGRWNAWDAIERRLARPERLSPPDRGWAAAEAAALAGGLLGLGVAVSTGIWWAAGVAAVIGALAGLVVRVSSRSPTPETTRIARILAAE